MFELPQVSKDFVHIFPLSHLHIVHEETAVILVGAVEEVCKSLRLIMLICRQHWDICQNEGVEFPTKLRAAGVIISSTLLMTNLIIITIRITLSLMRHNFLTYRITDNFLTNRTPMILPTLGLIDPNQKNEKGHMLSLVWK